MSNTYFFFKNCDSGGKQMWSIDQSLVDSEKSFFFLQTVCISV